MAEYLSINDKESAIDSLLRAEEYILRVVNPAQDYETPWNSFSWKWIIICLQNSLYTFALAVAAGTNPGIVQRKNGRVVDLMTALKLCIGVTWFAYSVPVEFTRNQKNSILWLHLHFRNGFEHFLPNNTWGILLRGMPNVCIDVLETIKCLALDSKNILYASPNYESQEKERKIETSISSSIAILKSYALYDPGNKIEEFPKLDKLWDTGS